MLHQHVRRHYSLARASISTILSTLSRVVKRRLTRKHRMRLSNVNCFRPYLAAARPIAVNAGQGTAGIGLGTVRFHTSRALGGRFNILGIGDLGKRLSFARLAGRRVSLRLAGCFQARPFVQECSFRCLYKVTEDATVQRVQHLHSRNGLGGVNKTVRPVCMPRDNCCNGGRRVDMGARWS